MYQYKNSFFNSDNEDLSGDAGADEMSCLSGRKKSSMVKPETAAVNVT